MSGERHTPPFGWGVPLLWEMTLFRLKNPRFDLGIAIEPGLLIGGSCCVTAYQCLTAAGSARTLRCFTPWPLDLLVQEVERVQIYLDRRVSQTDY